MDNPKSASVLHRQNKEKTKESKRMKKLTIVCLAIGLVLAFSSIVMATSTPGGGIVGTSHDLSSAGRGASFGDLAEQTTGQDRICIYCHAPHNTMPVGSNGRYTYTPLWNHAVTAQVYNTYSNGTDEPNGTQHASYAEALAAQPGSVSMLCLSCHDGTVATNAYGGWVPGQATGAGDRKIAAGTRASIGAGGDLSNHHPVGMPYDPNLDSELYPATTTVNAKAGVSLTINDLLWNGNVECTSCHDVHNTQNAGWKFVWADEHNSGLCLTCHAKGNI